MNDRKFQKKLDKMRKKGERYKQEYELVHEYAKYVPDKKRRKVSNVMLAVAVIAIVGYAVATFDLQYNMGIEISATLTTCWYSVWGAEFAALAAIKCSKTKHGSSDTSFGYEYVEQEQAELYNNESYE